jgi:hypothetical protein
MRNLTATLCLTISVLLGSAGVSYAGLFGPSNYNECILERMKGVTSDLAARAIVGACAAKFSSNKKSTPPSKKPEYKPELDDSGIPICRVYPVGDEWKFATREMSERLKTTHELWDVSKPGKQTYYIFLRKGTTAAQAGQVIRGVSYNAYDACRNYYLCKGGNSYFCD